MKHWRGRSPYKSSIETVSLSLSLSLTINLIMSSSLALVINAKSLSLVFDCELFLLTSLNKFAVVRINVQLTVVFYVRCTRSWRQSWTHVSWRCTCINVTRWHWKNCSQFSLWEIVQSKPLRRCWTSSWNNLTLSTCVSSTFWNTPSNSTSIRDWSKTDTKVGRICCLLVKTGKNFIFVDVRKPIVATFNN